MPIFDQGYQHWNGQLTKPSTRWMTIARHGIALGKKNILLRLAILFAWLPAVLLAAFLCVWGLIEQKSEMVQPIVPFIGGIVGQDVVDNAKDYRVEVWTLAYEYFLLTELRFSMMVVLLVGPSLISQDLRFNALPLYFSRPIRRIDYFLGKFGVIAYFLGMVLIVPSIIAWVLGNVFSLDISIIKDTFSLLVASIAYGILMTLSAGLLILAMSSLSRSSRYVGLFWIGIWFVTSIVGTVMEGVSREDRMSKAYMKSWEMERSLQQSSQAKNMTNEERMKKQTEIREARRRVMEEATREEIEAAKHDWRPMVSYTGNLSRIGQQWLGSDKSWERFAQSVPEEYRAQWLMGRQGPRYPWYWSMILLLVLIGISVCILNFRVKSLDRLKVKPIVEFREVSKWYGNVIGVNRLSLRIPAGITGLLGPNGAGKSTLLQLATGQLYPSQGQVRVLGQKVWNNPGMNRYIGLCPEQDAFYEWMTGWDFVYTSARLSGMTKSDARDATARTLDAVTMTYAKDRIVRGYSKGMRQRTKLAQALVHDPQVLFLDEPFTGTDPVARRDLMDIIRRLAESGKSIVVSSHVLHEVETLTPNIVLLNRGRLVAEGQTREIRELIDKHPHHIVLVCDEYRKLAGHVLNWDDVEGVRVLNREKGLMVETRAPDKFYQRLPQLSLTDGLAIKEVYSDDDSLEAVFKYLVSK